MEAYYEDDFVALYHGDCREVMPSLDFDAVVTDPPYGIDWQPPHGVGIGDHGPAIANDTTTEVRDWVRERWPEIPTLMFGSLRAAMPAGVRSTLVFHKACVGAGLVGNRLPWLKDWEPIFVCGKWPDQTPKLSGVIRTYEAAATGYSGYVTRSGHPHAKPVDVMMQLINACPPGVIADPFAGSGSTLRAAKDAGRIAIGIEIEERYCEVAAKRLSQEVLDFGGAA